MRSLNPVAEYIPDSSIDAQRDRELRALLSLCFTKPQDAVFRERRYFAERYERRWIIRDERGAMIAHLGAHAKTIEARGQSIPIGGIAEVCVHPGYRRRGFVRLMLQRAHAMLAGDGFAFAALFGDPNVYRSSGYTESTNVLRQAPDGRWRPAVVLYKQLGDAPWPDGEVFLPGPEF